MMRYPVDPLKNCLHLQCKQMLYGAERSPQEQEELEKSYGRCDTTVYWCDRTQTGRGPDDERVNPKACSQPRRSCFAGIKNSSAPR
jgi:hypothetical protein